MSSPIRARLSITVLACLFFAWPAFSQSRTAPLTISGPIPAGLSVSSFVGTEAVSRLYRFQVELRGGPAGGRTSLDALLGQRFTVSATQPDGATRHFSGICNRVSQGSDESGAFIRLELVPQFWLLTRNARSRMFQDLSVPQIIGRVLADHGISFEFALQSPYSPRACAIQYGETDFEFISRLAEEEGIYYVFRHQPGGQHTMLLGDTPPGHPVVPGPSTLEFMRGNAPKSRAVTVWEKAQELRAGKYRLRDHSFELEGDLEVEINSQESVSVGEVNHRLVTGANAGLEIYDYPGGYAQRFDGVTATLAEVLEEGRRTVAIRMQQEAANAIDIEAASDYVQLVAGHRFTLAGHPGGADGEYVLTSVQHSARVAGGGGATLEYTNSFTCIPAGLPFRPQRLTAIPTIPGPEPAIVAGPPGETVHTDGLGRVKVKFPWDLDSSGGEDSSCWIRVAAPAPGMPLVLPEVGDEVLVSFLGGDPDRPVILGGIPNPR